MDETKTPAGNGEEAKIITAICARYENAPPALIEILHDVQVSLGQVAETAQTRIAVCLNITRAEVHGVTSFYDDFHIEAAPDTVVRICRGEACQSLGAQRLFDAARDSAEGMPGVEVEAVYCLGNCALAPAATVNEVLHGRLGKDRLSELMARTTRRDEVAN